MSQGKFLRALYPQARGDLRVNSVFLQLRVYNANRRIREGDGDKKEKGETKERVLEHTKS